MRCSPRTCSRKSTSRTKQGVSTWPSNSLPPSRIWLVWKSGRGSSWSRQWPHPSRLSPPKNPRAPKSSTRPSKPPTKSVHSSKGHLRKLSRSSTTRRKRKSMLSTLSRSRPMPRKKERNREEVLSRGSCPGERTIKKLLKR